MNAIDLDRPWSTARIVAFDTETTGVNTDEDRIVEVGLAIFEGGELLERWGRLVDPGVPLPPETTQITGIKPEDLIGAPRLPEILDELLERLGSGVVLVYNSEFDTRILASELRRHGREFAMPPVLDPFPFCWEHLRERSLTRNAQLGTCAEFLGVPLEEAHRATHDAEAAARVLFALRAYADLPERLAELLQVQAAAAQRVAERFARFRRKSATASEAREVLGVESAAAIELDASYLYGDEPDPVRALLSRLPDVRET